VGGVKNSAHLKGLAADIAVPDNVARLNILRGLIIAGFRRIGINKTARQSSLSALFQAKTGGGGGNRTRVQRYVEGQIYMLSCLCISSEGGKQSNHSPEPTY